MSDSKRLDDKHARNREQRVVQIREWAKYVRTHPDEDWGKQVNRILNSQLQSARHFEHDRPDPESLRHALLRDEDDSGD